MVISWDAKIYLEGRGQIEEEQAAEKTRPSSRETI
jgi:hypothetical protein